ncbi:MAG: sulfite exporter TauE/SafE family protein [Cyclobacteriaceae bacterium]
MEFDFLVILFFISALYASVGHGGASGYLALMAFYSFSLEIMRPSALVLNLFVAGISFIQFYRTGYFKLRLLLPFILSSVPMSFLGGMITLDPTWYKRILGVLLIAAILRLAGVIGNMPRETKPPQFIVGLMIGGIIGFFSGVIGIGGGIILSPMILLLGWDNVKETAAVSAAFIWINSLAGLFGMVTVGNFMIDDIWSYVLIAVAGGAIGAYLGSFKSNLRGLRLTLSFVLIIASFKLIFF